MVRNLRRLDAAYPSYLTQARAFETSDPLRAPIARIEEEMLRQSPGLDLVVLPSDTPSILTRFMMAGLAPSDCDAVAVRVKQSKDELEVVLAGADGAIPQNIAWRCASNAPDDLLRRLSGLPVRRLVLLDADELPKAVIEAAARLSIDTRLLVARPSTKRRTAIFPDVPVIAITPAVREAMMSRANCTNVEALAAPALPQLQPPALGTINVALAIVGIGTQHEDLALLQALAKTVNGSVAHPSIVVAGALPPQIVSSLPEAIHVSGAVSDEELPVWLGRLGPQALFFANRKWGMADPRLLRGRLPELPSPISETAFPAARVLTVLSYRKMRRRPHWRTRFQDGCRCSRPEIVSATRVEFFQVNCVLAPAAAGCSALRGNAVRSIQDVSAAQRA